MVYGKDLERMWEDVRACNVRQRLPFWFLKKYLFRLARWMLLINNYLVRLHLTLRASQ